MPKISVIIPIYNVEKYLKRCLDSLLEQTFTDFEAICVNDGSADKSLHILKEYAKKDTRIKIVTQSNQGLSMARNNGLKIAQGNYIYFLDSDDAIHPQLLQIAHTFAIKHNADMVCFGYKKSDGIKYAPQNINIEKLQYKITDKPLNLALSNSKFRIPFNVWTKFYKKEILNDINFIKGILYEDYPHTYAILAKSPKTVLIDAQLYFYTLNKNSISHQKITVKQIESFNKGVEFVINEYKNKPELKKIKHGLLPKLLKHQLKRCKKAPKEIKEQMYKIFSSELKNLFSKNLVSVFGCGFLRYLTYKKIAGK